MWFDTINEFLSMGGYGFYVWLSYGVTFAILAANIMFPIIKLKKITRLLRGKNASST